MIEFGAGDRGTPWKLLDHIPMGTHAVVEHTLDKGSTHLSWDIHQTRDNYSSLDM